MLSLSNIWPHKNYCNKIPTCIKCADNHLIAWCPQQGRIDNVKCSNCQANHPASYKGCIVRKQLQQKLFPSLRKRTETNNNHLQYKLVLTQTLNNSCHNQQYLNASNKTYAQIIAEDNTQQQIQTPNTHTNNHTAREFTELKQ